MKKALYFVLTLAMTLSFVACGSKEKETMIKKKAEKKLHYWYLVR